MAVESEPGGDTSKPRHRILLAQQGGFLMGGNGKQTCPAIGHPAGLIELVRQTQGKPVLEPVIACFPDQAVESLGEWREVRRNGLWRIGRKPGDVAMPESISLTEMISQQEALCAAQAHAEDGRLDGLHIKNLSNASPLVQSFDCTGFLHFLPFGQWNHAEDDSLHLGASDQMQVPNLEHSECDQAVGKESLGQWKEGDSLRLHRLTLLKCLIL